MINFLENVISVGVLRQLSGYDNDKMVVVMWQLAASQDAPFLFSQKDFVILIHLKVNT